MTTLKQFLASLTFIQIKEISRHAKGLLLALEKSNRKEMLDYEVIPTMKVWKKYDGKKIFYNDDLKE